jgi:hypothetical protein
MKKRGRLVVRSFRQCTEFPRVLVCYLRVEFFVANVAGGLRGSPRSFVNSLASPSRPRGFSCGISDLGPI